MPVHDWSRVEPGIFHDFHQAWTIELRNSLNQGGLPAGYFAMAEQVLGGPVADVVTLQGQTTTHRTNGGAVGVSVVEAPPRARFVRSADVDSYVRMANRVVIRHHVGQVVAVVEIVSPGNKSSRHAIRSFVDKAIDLLRQHVNLLIVDLFPPSARDPQGIHKAIWDEVQEDRFELPLDKPLTSVAYKTGEPWMAYVEPMAVGDPLPPLPIFLDADMYVPAPLEGTYEVTWKECPGVIQDLVDPPENKP